MPHAALWVVQPERRRHGAEPPLCFNAARGFVCGAAAEGVFKMNAAIVSMPHAALWVVQLRRSQLLSP